MMFSPRCPGDKEFEKDSVYAALYKRTLSLEKNVVDAQSENGGLRDAMDRKDNQYSRLDALYHCQLQQNHDLNLLLTQQRECNTLLATALNTLKGKR